MKITWIKWMSVAAAGLLLAAGCAGGLYTGGDPIPEGADVVSVRQVLDDPGSYQGRPLVVEGYFQRDACPSCFILKEGAASLKVEPSRNMGTPPGSNNGKKALVLGEIEAGEKTGQEIILHATGISFS